MQDQPPYVDDVPEKRITVMTRVGGGNAETSIQESGTLGVKEGFSGPTHVTTIINPSPPADPREQHHQALAKARIGDYGDFSKK